MVGGLPRPPDTGGHPLVIQQLRWRLLDPDVAVDEADSLDHAVATRSVLNRSANPSIGSTGYVATSTGDFSAPHEDRRPRL